MIKPPPKYFEHVKSAAWVQPVMKDYYMQCCDCCLVHRMTFRIVNGRVQFKAFRNEGATKEHRKRIGIKIVSHATKSRKR